MFVYELVNPKGSTARIYSNPDSAIKGFQDYQKFCPNYFPKVPTEYRWHDGSFQFKNYDTSHEWKEWGKYNILKGNDVFRLYRTEVQD